MNAQSVICQDEYYVSPLAGNGEIVTTFGPSGYHDTPVPDGMHDTRQIAWAGRRMQGPTHPLIRFGRVTRNLAVDGTPVTDSDWSQTLDYERGLILSQLQHGSVRECTRSLVCLEHNLLIFHSCFENASAAETRVLDFTRTYAFPDTIDSDLHAPAPHLRTEDRKMSEERVVDLRIKSQDDGFSVYYRIGRQLGEVRLACSAGGEFSTTKQGGCCVHRFILEPGSKVEVWTWLTFSDRQRFTHFPELSQLQVRIEEHLLAWQKFWKVSRIEFDDERLTAFRIACLYCIRCNASPWSIPPGYFHGYWEGRTFHDELYPFLGLLTAGHTKLARRIPAFRLSTLGKALYAGGGLGAHFPWESTEVGDEGGPYGHWHDERFHLGQIALEVWKLYLYERDDDELRRFYPILHGCTQMLIQDVLVRDAQGVLRTRQVTDFDENFCPVSNGIFTICATIRTLEIAANAAEILQCDARQRLEWLLLAESLRQSMSGQEIYTASDDAPTGYWHLSQVGPIYPFAVDVNSPKARRTLDALHRALKTNRNVTAGGGLSNAQASHWIWATALLATAYNLQGRSDEGIALMRQMPNSAGPFLSPNERRQDDRSSPFVLPWFTTAAGAALFAMHSSFVQVNVDHTILLQGVGLQFGNASFSGLEAGFGVKISGEIREGRAVQVTLDSPGAVNWFFALPARHAKELKLPWYRKSADLYCFMIELEAGKTALIE